MARRSASDRASRCTPHDRRLPAAAIAAAVVCCGLVAGVLAAAGCAALGTGERFERERSERHALDGREVAIYQPAGDVVVEPDTGRAVVVRVTVFGPDADRVRVRTERDDDAAELSVSYPDSTERIIFPDTGPFSRSIFWMRDDGTFGEGFPTSREVTVAPGGDDGVRAYTAMRVGVPPGRSLELYLGAGRAAVRNVDGALEIDSRSARVDATGTRGPLDIDTGSGAVRVVDAEGPIEINTGSGDVALTRVRGPRIGVKTGTGDIDGEVVAAHAVDVYTGIGAIDLDGVRADEIQLRSATGPIRARIAGEFRHVEVDGESGDITLSIPRTADTRLELDSDEGVVWIEPPYTVLEHGEDGIVAHFGCDCPPTAAGVVEVETDEGAIQIVGR